MTTAPVLALLASLAAAAPAVPDDDAGRVVDVLQRFAVDAADDPHAAWPADLVVRSVRSSDAGLIVVVDGSFPRAGDDDLRAATERLEAMRESFVGALDGAGVVGGVALHVVDATGVERPVGADLEVPSVVPAGRAPRRRVRVPGSIVQTQKTERLPFGAALAGMRIAISPGHGWLDSDDNGTFFTQRENFKFTGCGTCRGITEDFFSSEFVGNQLMPLLVGMGAEVVLVRELDRDTAPARVIDDGSATVRDGSFVVVSGGINGARQASAPGTGALEFAIGQGSRAVRHVQVRFPVVADASTAAIVTVVHAGGARTINVDQTDAPGAWLDLGAFALDATSTLTIAAGPGTGRLVVDAVKIGGGTFEAEGTKPWWQMAARSYVPERGNPDVPVDVSSRSDVTIRPTYAELFDPDLYVSIHANASGVANSTTNGLSVYRYNCSDARFPDHSSSSAAAACDDPPGSAELLDQVYPALLGELRTSWDPHFGDRGRLVANFGELRELGDTPGILVESAFFDNLASPSGSSPPSMPDNRALHDPRFRERFARGLARGIARFLAPGSDVPPERPAGLLARNVDGGLLVSWSGVAGASGYRVSTATVGADAVRAFDDGVVVTGTSLALQESDGAVRAIRVAALNSNGEGLPSPVVVARVGVPGALVINAYDRRDPWVQDVDNDFSYGLQHAAALAAASTIAFDGALDEVVEAGDVALGAYDFVDFAAGKDSTVDEPVSKTMQGILETYVNAGGRLLVSGEEVGYALVQTSSDPDDATFLDRVLGATYVADDAAAYDVDGAAAFAGFSGRFDDGSGGVYEVIYPDVLAPTAGASQVLSWPDGTAAATMRTRAMLLGAPFEAIVPASSRAQLMGLILHALDVPEPVVSGGEGEGEGEGTPVVVGEGEGEGEGTIVAGEGEGEGDDPGGLGAGDDDPVRVTPAAEDGGCGCATTTQAPMSLLAWSALGACAVGRRRRIRR